LSLIFKSRKVRFDFLHYCYVLFVKVQKTNIDKNIYEYLASTNMNMNMITIVTDREI